MKSKPNDSGANNAAGGSEQNLTRRSFLAQAGIATGAAASAGVWMSGVTHASSAAAGARTLIVINQRGAADGLSTAAPVLDPEYQNVRSSTRILPPPTGSRAWLDADFAMAPGGIDSAGVDWVTPYEDGHLCFVHGAGIVNQSRSHFTAQFVQELGVNPGDPFLSDGWAARHMGLIPPSISSIRGLGIGTLLAKALAGAPLTLPVPDLMNLSFPGPVGSPTASIRQSSIMSSYAATPYTLAKDSASDTFAALATLTSVTYPTPGAGLFPDTPFGNAMANAAAIIKDATVFVEVIHIDIPGWDTHSNQDPNNPGGVMHDLLKDLSTSIGAFYQDLGGAAGVDDYVLVTYTEFGRQIAENLSAGTDHGYGGVMAVMGSGLHLSSGGSGGTVYHNILPLASSYDPLNMDALKIDYDARDVLAEILVNRHCLTAAQLSTVFPNHAFPSTALGIVG